MLFGVKNGCPPVKEHSYVIYWCGFELIIPIITAPPSNSTSVV